jgi:alkanesulfonate monooxygenase SsuD/methylene tetrahydromethanopterin reductase-like flavin-dependent oxidoreductase (luciferase family)
MPAPTRPLHLAVAIDGRQKYSAASAYYVELARLAEHGTLDFVTLEDSPAPPEDGTGRLDALAVLTRVAPATDRIGLVPTVTTTHTGPFPVPAALATLDRASDGRAGWTVRVSTTGAGVSVLGPSGVPGSPQGDPVISVPVTDPDTSEIAARYADVAYIRATDRPSAGTAREALRTRARAHGRDPGALTVLADLAVDFRGGENRAGAIGHSGGPLYQGGPVHLADLIADWQQSGAVDGFHIRPLDPPRDLERFVNGTVALLQHRSLFRGFYPGTTLREHLGLARPVNRYTLAREADR